MSRRGRSALAIAIVVVAVVAAWIVRRHPTPPLAGGDAGRQRLALAWPAGQRFVYALTWTTRDDATLPLGAKPVHSTVDLDADLVVSSLGRGARGYALALTLEHVRRHDFSFFGAPLLADDAAADAAFAGQAAVAYLEPSGRVSGIMFRPDASELFKHVIQALLTETALTLAPPDDHAIDTWSTVEATTHGRARTEYTVADHDVTRTRTAFQNVRGFQPADLAASAQKIRSVAHAHVEPAGHIGSFHLREDLAVGLADGGTTSLEAEQALDLVLTSSGPFDPTALAALAPSTTEERSVGEPTGGASLDDMLAKRAAGLTIDQVISDLTAHPEGQLPEHSRWLWRTTGLLTLHPELCGQLVGVFADARLKSAGRQLVLDLVAQSGGTPESQAALRTMLVSDAAKTDAQYGLMVQRVSLVPRPNAETVGFVADLYGDAGKNGKTELKYASAYALGSATGKALAGGAEDRAAARAQNDRLRRDLGTAVTPADKAALLHAVGNVGLHDNASAVLALRADTDPSVRQAVAVALRKDKDAAVTTTLVGLATDPSPKVQEASLGALAGRRLDARQLGELGDAVATSNLAKRNDALAVTLMQEQPASDARAKVLALIIARNADRPQLQTRARALQ